MSQNSIEAGVDESLLDSAAACLNEESVRALSEMKLLTPAVARLELLAQKANEGELSPEESREYFRFIELEDVLATLRLKAERQLASPAA